MNPNNMLIPLLLKEFDQECAITRTLLRAVPEGAWGFKPHAKSMSQEQLTVHLAELPSWASMALNTDGIDFAAMDYTPTAIASRADLLTLFERSVADGRSHLERANDADLLPSWTLRTGDTIHAVYTKYETIRHALAQTIHHRAQLGVYLRLQDVPVPATYGPSADDAGF